MGFRSRIELPRTGASYLSTLESIPGLVILMVQQQIGHCSQTTAGILEDLVMLGGYQEIAVDFVANNPGLTLFHRHQPLHMDFGFMTLFDYA